MTFVNITPNRLMLLMLSDCSWMVIIFVDMVQDNVIVAVRSVHAVVLVNWS